MTDVAFVAAGWIGTAVVLLAYAASVGLRLRRARTTTKVEGTR